MEMQNKIKMLERYLGFPVHREDLIPESKNRYDESFSYWLCQRFYGKEEQMRIAIGKTTEILTELIRNKSNNKLIAIYFSLLGNLYYLRGDFTKSINCFMKSSSYNKNDLGAWLELAFALRAYGDFTAFEGIIFNLEGIYGEWKNDADAKLSKEKVLDMVSKQTNQSRLWDQTN